MTSPPGQPPALARSVELDRKRRSRNAAIIIGSSVPAALVLTGLVASEGQRFGAAMALLSACANALLAAWAWRRPGDGPALVNIAVTLAATVGGIAMTGNSGPGLWVFGVMVLVAAATLPSRWVVATAVASLLSFAAALALDRGGLALPWRAAAGAAATLFVVAAAVAILASRSWAGVVRSLATEELRAREAEAARRSSDARYRLIADSVSDLISVMTEDRRWVFMSPSHERVLGVPVEQLLRDRPGSHLHEDDTARARELVRAAFATGSSRGRFRFRRADGSYVPMDALLTAAAFDGERVVVIACRDRTGEDELFEKLRRSQMMEVIGSVAGGVAHDFNNLLSVVRSCAQFAKGSLPPGHAAQEDLEDVLAAADRGAALTTQLLAVARRQVMVTGEVDAAACVRDLARLLPRILGSDVVVRLDVEDEVGTVAVPATALEQVLLNLAVNARDAMPNGGELSIRARRVDVDAPGRGAVAPGRYAAFEVKDSGKGMTEEVRARAFEPFFTTKGPGRGTGLGLATCHAIVSQAGGGIELETAPARGSTFTVLLPLSTRGPAAAPARPARTGPATVLVVDDEPFVRSLMVRLVSGKGRRVIEAENATGAFARVEAEARPPDLLLTDVMLAGEDGVALAAELRRRYPGLAVILTSGYTQDPAAVQRLVEGGMVFVPKPFPPAELVRAVDAALHASDGTEAA